MQTSKKTGDKRTKRESTKDDPFKKLEEKQKTIPTPRNFIQKSSTADIYSRSSNQKKTVTSKSNMAVGSLKSSPSSISQNSSRSFRSKITDTQKTSSARDVKATKNSIKSLPMNVTVNSPIQRRKELNDKVKKVTSKEVGLKPKENSFNKLSVKEIRQDSKSDTIKKISSIENGVKSKEGSTKKVVIPERQRTSTRTLDEKEIKVLTPDVVDNNAELLNLTKKLSAKPKAFYVDLKDDKEGQLEKQKSSDEEVSYEDDFESYESDFDSYHSDEINDTSDDVKSDSDENKDNSDKDDIDDIDSGDVHIDDDEGNSKEERMLDSGNFELRDSRSASKSKPMDYITEISEETEKKKYDERDKKISLTDEGFQEMSSGLSSIKTIHVDVLDRPLFIDFTKSKENRRKQRIFEKLKQRAKDILGMVTLHEVSYNLFEMAPIPYDLYMATFGRSNYTQTSIQTFDDGITEEVQTDEILCNNKWTQCPVEFSSNDICINKSYCKETKVIGEFTFFDDDVQEEAIDEDLKNDPLRVFLEQKDGAGSDKVMANECYKTKLKDNKYNVIRLKKFLKKTESKISSILSSNIGNTEMSNLIKTSKFPFSTGYLLISTKNIESFLKNSKIICAVLSENKNNLIMTVHEKFKSGVASGKCILCLWDLGIAIREPLKILIATDNITIGRFRGNIDGYFVGALEDGSIHLWDLSEEPTWCYDVIQEKSTKLVEVESKHLTQTERDREWNLRNSECVQEKNLFPIAEALQASSYTSSAIAMTKNENVNTIVGLEFIGDGVCSDGRKIIRQLCSLQRTGILTIWSIIQEKYDTKDIGKAFWSKLILERNQIINLIEYLNMPMNNETNFNLNAAKKRLIAKKQERLKISRPKSAIKNDIDRPNSAANIKNKVLTDNNAFDLFGNGVEFNHLKVMNFDNNDYYLVGINYGEVLYCKRSLGNFIVKRICVANTASSITRLETSAHNLPYFLAATDCGTVNLCSLLDSRVLLTLDCRNSPTTVVDKCQADNKGRFISSVEMKSPNVENVTSKPITSLSWLHDPFSIIAVSDRVCVWELTHSDIQTTATSGGVGSCSTSDKALVLLTTEGEVQVYKLNDEKKNLDLFEKYVALL